MMRDLGLRHLTRIAVGLAPLVVAIGCGEPASGPPDPPGGGEEIVLDYARFVADVAPIMAQRGCDAAGDCHGGGIRGTFELSPPEAKDPEFDFDQVSLQVTVFEPESSPILRKPLAEAAGGTPHSHEPFTNMDDPDYQTLLEWILEGEVR